MTAALAALLATGGALATPAAIGSATRCQHPGTRVVGRRGGAALLESGRNSNWTIHVFSCWEPTGRVHLITSQDQATEFSLSHVLFNGQFVAGDAHEVGFGGDSASEGDEIFSVDARSGRTLQDLTPPGVENLGDVPGETTNLYALVLAGDGGLAYIGSAYRPCPAAIGLVVADRAGHRTLDCPVKGEQPSQAIAGLRLHGLTVTWRHGGITHSARLG